MMTNSPKFSKIRSLEEALAAFTRHDTGNAPADDQDAPLSFMEALDDVSPRLLLEVTSATEPLPWSEITLKGFKPEASQASAKFTVTADSGVALEYTAEFNYYGGGDRGRGGRYGFMFTEARSGTRVASQSSVSRDRTDPDAQAARAQAAARTKGAALIVFATIIQIMKKFVAIRQPDQIKFSSAETSRTKLYSTLARRFGSSQYTLEMPPEFDSRGNRPTSGYFLLTRKNSERAEEPINSVADLPPDQLVILIKQVNHALDIIVPKDYDARDEEEVFSRVRQIYMAMNDAKRAMEKAQNSGDRASIEKARKKVGHRFEMAQAISAKNAIKLLFKLEGGKPPTITRMNLTALYRYLDGLRA